MSATWHARPARQPKHHCHAIGCGKAVPPRLVMCLAHWKLVPADLRKAIWREYRPGQEIDKQPSRAYMVVQRQAVNAVARKEGRQPLPELTLQAV